MFDQFQDVTRNIPENSYGRVFWVKEMNEKKKKKKKNISNYLTSVLVVQCIVS